MPAKLIYLFVMEFNKGGVRVKDLFTFLNNQGQILINAWHGDHGHCQVIETLKNRQLLFEVMRSTDSRCDVLHGP